MVYLFCFPLSIWANIFNSICIFNLESKLYLEDLPCIETLYIIRFVKFLTDVGNADVIYIISMTSHRTKTKEQLMLTFTTIAAAAAAGSLMAPQVFLKASFGLEAFFANAAGVGPLFVMLRHVLLIPHLCVELLLALLALEQRSVPFLFVRGEMAAVAKHGGTELALDGPLPRVGAEVLDQHRFRFDELLTHRAGEAVAAPRAHRLPPRRQLSASLVVRVNFVGLDGLAFVSAGRNQSLFGVFIDA